MIAKKSLSDPGVPGRLSGGKVGVEGVRCHLNSH